MTTRTYLPEPMDTAKIIDRFREIGIDARKSGQRISFDGAIAGRLLELVLWEAAMGPQSGQR